MKEKQIIKNKERFEIILLKNRIGVLENKVRGLESGFKELRKIKF